MELDPAETLGRLADRSLDWVAGAARYLGSPRAASGMAPFNRATAMLQLAMLCRYWEKARRDDGRLAEATAVVRRSWQDPTLLSALDVSPRYASANRLIYAALAPGGVPETLLRRYLGTVVADGYLDPAGKTPLGGIATRHYAELAGAAHNLAPYRELFQATPLGLGRPAPVAALDVCVVAHAAFYLTDFGFRTADLPPAALEHARQVTGELLACYVSRDEWESTAKLLLAWSCLGADPVATATGRGALRLLAGAQQPDGSVPGKSPALRVPADAGPEAYLHAAFQPTFVTALTSVILSASRLPSPA
jgi:hypothetical protein